MSKSYKIYAKKGKKTMPIKVESKHIYHNSTQYDMYVYRPVPDATTDNELKGYNITGYNINRLFDTDNNITISQGNREDQRQGNKINIKGVNCTIAISMDPDVLVNSFSHGDNVDLEFKFRIMAVRFNSDDKLKQTDGGVARTINDGLAEWFRDTYIYYNQAGTTSGGHLINQSVWMDKMRDSTKWTGSFKIMKDKKFTLSRAHTSTQFNFNLGFNREVNFENTTNKPTLNQRFNHIYIFIITPSNYRFDMDTTSYAKAKTITQQQQGLSLFHSWSNVKIIYYDI